MTFADVNDVAKRLGRPASGEPESDQWEAWLEDIEAIILARVPGLSDAVTAGRPTLATVKMVEANAVIRKINNPTGKKSERLDDYYYDRDATAARSDLFLTGEEWALLTPAPDGAFSIRTYSHSENRGEWLHPDVWVPLP